MNKKNKNKVTSQANSTKTIFLWEFKADKELFQTSKQNCRANIAGQFKMAYIRKNRKDCRELGESVNTVEVVSEIWEVIRQLLSVS